MSISATEQQLHQIYDATLDTLYAFVSRRCNGQRELAEDVTQETWLRAVAHWRRNGLPDNPLAWLTTVAKNLILMHLRRRETLSLDQIASEEILAVTDNESASDAEEIASLVNLALTRLPPAEAKLLESFHYDHRKMSQLAATHGVSERAIEGRLRRARARLRREIEITLLRERGVA